MPPLDSTAMRTAEAEYNRGYHDAVANSPCAPTSLDYLKGYEFGRETARIGISNGHALRVSGSSPQP